MKLPKIYISPVNDLIYWAIEEINNGEIGYILSQRQHNNLGGYIPTDIKKLSQSFLERDHFCPDFNNFSTQIKYDAELFKIIHLDLWSNNIFNIDNLHKCVDEFLSYNPNLLFEFGTEDYVKLLPVDEMENILSQIKPEILSKIVYLVAQGGSVVFDLKNVSPIDIDKTKQYIELAKKYDMKIKRHNCDFHTLDEPKILKALGIESYNFAPEFSMIYNREIYYRLCNDDISILKEKLLLSPWDRWLYNTDDVEKLFLSCLHYIQDPIIDHCLLSSSLKTQIKEKIQNKLKEILICIQ